MKSLTLFLFKMGSHEVSWSQTHNVAKAGPELLILLPFHLS